MKFYRSIISIAIILFCSFYSGAQDTNYVYRDSALLYEDSVATKAVELAPAEEEGYENYEEYSEDTILTNNQLIVERDSMRALKNSSSFAYAKNLDSLLYDYQQKLNKDKAPRKNQLPWLARFFLSPVTKYFFWLLAAVFVSFILYKLFFTAGFFQRSYATTNVTALPEETGNLSNHADIAKLIAKAIGSGDFRMALRYHYLQSLQKLSAKGIIQLAAYKTNYQYIRELTGKPYKNAFASLTLHYEYVWYGAFEIDEIAFNSIQNKFKKFNSEI